MNIGQAAKETKLNAKTIRYYEEIGLIAPARLQNGYRDYSDSDVNILNFLKMARNLSFSIDNCRQLLGLYADEARASRDVKLIVATKLIELDEIIKNSLQMKATLQHLSDNCRGDNRPDCAILDGLSAKP